MLWVKEENAQSIQQLILANHFPSRVTILLIAHEPRNVYQSAFPINLLRNIGLQSVTTTHVCVLDSDLSLSGPFLRFVSSRILLEIAPIAPQIAHRRSARASLPSYRVFAQRRRASLDRGSAGLHSARRVFASSSWTKIDSKKSEPCVIRRGFWINREPSCAPRSRNLCDVWRMKRSSRRRDRRTSRIDSM